MLPSSLPPVFDAGCVWLVEAGSGDSGPLTPRVSHAFRRAEIILTRPAAAGEYSFALTQGAAGGLGPASRWRTEPAIAHRPASDRPASAGRVGGAASQQGYSSRGGEEALALAAAGIPFRMRSHDLPFSSS